MFQESRIFYWRFPREQRPHGLSSFFTFFFSYLLRSDYPNFPINFGIAPFYDYHPLSINRPVRSATVNHVANSRMTRYRSDFPSKPIPGSSGIVM